ncbi:RNA methyltransferase [Oxalicibacterium faecigallinarum]|uniref:tRNA (cytidine/uridine-2'-O-)-methyltransferase TrmJ n=1 Tax=Oxalicibacterium faecigallinarum TaxID=573741 RepID=A0A8J3ANB5_9BURK|nr:RNA methyltransferase [Oxalicibacterium faecigallinarum]GGI17698.1 tRNA (cytidine/uridine-2'-O-)-methyltransferase TrmJ [Oxalicibacterium faecigallinarum]
MNLPQIDMPLFNRLRFVLVETSRAGNIGATARAMKNMGFSDLVLVNPRFSDALTNEEAVAFASGAQDILTSARVVGSIEEALVDCNFSAAVTARLREFSPPVLTPRVFATRLQQDANLNAAVVFGNERFGLPNDIVQRCNVLINIPANPDYSSLNLAQAVQVISYEARMADAEKCMSAADAAIGFQGEVASLAQIDGMYAHLEQALIAIDFLDPDNPKKLMPRLKRLFARTELETEEVNILRGIASQILTARKKRKTSEA